MIFKIVNETSLSTEIETKYSYEQHFLIARIDVPDANNPRKSADDCTGFDKIKKCFTARSHFKSRVDCEKLGGKKCKSKCMEKTKSLGKRDHLI